AGRGSGNGDGVIHANEHAGLRGQLQFLAFAHNDVSGAARQADAESARGVAKDGADERAAAGADGPRDNVALDVVLLFDDLPFLHFDVLAAPAVGLTARLLDGDDTHLHRNETALDFDGAKR